MSPDATAAKAASALAPLTALFAGQTAVIFASGPSLTKLWNKERSIPVPSIAVSDAWKIAPTADVLYSTDGRWWLHHKAVPDFAGAKIGYQGPGPAGVIWIRGSGRAGFDPRLGWVRHGHNSGHAAVHLAAQLGATRIVLVGFDMRAVNGKTHFFGDHPKQIRTPSNYEAWAENYRVLGKELAERGVEVLNATPGSALQCFAAVRLDDALERKAA